MMKIKDAKKWLPPIFITLITMLGLSLSPLPAQAAPILDFGIIAPTSGTISYAGGTTPLVGSGISVDNVVGLGTPLNAGTAQACVGCFLNFTTGNFISSVPQSLTFGAGGIITLTGAIPSLNIAPGTTLLDGSFSANPIVTSLGEFKLAGGGFADTKIQTLTNFFGLPNASFTGGFNVLFQAPGIPPSGFASTVVLSGDVANSPVPGTPEPGTLLLIGSGLVGIGVGARRGNRRK